tara:strand:+ start:2998 stop:3438 length:441 start_codon:yes stop_codon:yes gene_type:complete
MLESGSLLAMGTSLAMTTEAGALVLGSALAPPVVAGVVVAGAAVGVGIAVHHTMRSLLDGEAPDLAQPYWVAVHNFGKVRVHSFATRAEADAAIVRHAPLRRIGIKLGATTYVYGTPRPWREFAHEGFNTLVDNGMRDLLQSLATP